MRNIAVMAAVLLLSVAGFAQEDPERLDLSLLVAQVDEIGLATLDSVAALKQRSEDLVAQGNCQEAIPVLDEWAKSANQLAHFLRIGMEPFSGARGIDQQEYARSTKVAFQMFASVVLRAMELRRQRNQAMVLQAECQVAIGNPDLAASIYYQALDLMTLGKEEREYWDRARTGLYKLVGFVD